MFEDFCLFQHFKVHEDAANSYLSNGDVVVVNRNREPRYKDFIVYKKDGIFYISRVVATAGQSVTVMDDILYVNNKVKKEPYISKIKSEYLSTSDTQQPFTSDFSVNTVSNGKYNEVPKGYYLVLNDDRQNTNDSRSFGLIKESQIRGVVTFKVLPLNQFGFITAE